MSEDWKKYTDRSKNLESYHSITGKLVAFFSKILPRFSQREYLILLGIDDLDCVHEHERPKIFRGDNYNSIRDMLDMDKIKKNIKNKKINSIKKDELKKELYSILDSIDMYYVGTSRNNWQEKDFKKYDPAEIDKLRVYIDFKSEYDPVGCIYGFIQLAVFKEVKDDLFFGDHYNKDLKEFEEKVLKKYGAISMPATRAIISLHKRECPNIVATYELAEMYYYGNCNGIKKNMLKAYDLYEQAAGIDNLTREPDKMHCHPLALWALAYTLYNYHRKGSDLESCDTIPAIEEMDRKNKLSRLELAIKYAHVAMILNNNGPASNILGQIALLEEDEYPGITDLRTKYRMESAQHYFEYSVEQGYIYSLNNLAMLENELIFTDKVKETQHLNEMIRYLSLSAEQNEPWAANKLGELYRTGTVTCKKKISSSNEESKKTFNIINDEEAIKNYKLAIESFNDINSAWAYYNLLVHYPDNFKNNPQTIKEYVVNISQLRNQTVIDKTKKALPKKYGLNYDELLEG